jgi:hypothetical protein
MDRLPHNLPHTDAIKDEPFRPLKVITGEEAPATLVREK